MTNDAQLMTDRRLGEVLEDVASTLDNQEFHACVLREAARRLKTEKHYPDNYNYD